jgi:hypothetical protein
MTATVAGLGTVPEARWKWEHERLMSLPAAARRLGWSADVVHDWVKETDIPVVRTPGGRTSLYVSWVTAVLSSARPGQSGDMIEVTRSWWAKRGLVMKEAA